MPQNLSTNKGIFDFIGIGSSNIPVGRKLHVDGDINFNGNLYQNGVLFTGGDEAIWSTGPGTTINYSDGNVGIGTTNPVSAHNRDSVLVVGGGTGTKTSGITLGMGSDYSNGPYEILTSSEGSSASLRISDGTDARLTIRSNGNVGIGTTSPGAKLNVVGEATDDVVAKFKTTGTGTGDYSEIQIENDAGSRTTLGSIGSNYEAVDWANSNYLYNTGTGRNFWLKSQNDLGFFAGGYTIANHQRMTIKANGNVGIGTTIPLGPLHISDTNHLALTLTRETDILGSTSGAGTVIQGGALAGISPSMGALIGLVLKDADGGGTSTDGYIYFSTKDAGTGLSEKMRITSDGDVGIGESTANPGAKLEVVQTSGGTQFQVRGTAATGGQFQINNAGSNIYANFRGTGSNTDVIKLNTNGVSFFNGGNVGIGVTSPDCALTVISHNAPTGYTFKVGASGAGAEDRGIYIAAGRNAPSAAGDCVYIGFHDGDGSSSGGIRCSSTPLSPEFFAGSDVRMKKNIEDCDINGIEKIKSLRLRKWDWNTEKDITPTDLGLIADEVEEVYPELVSRQKMDGWEHCVSEGEEDLKTIPSESKITLTLIKAVQEQQTIIEDLKSRIENLENN